MAEKLATASTVLLLLSAVFLLLAVFFFILFNIPSVISDLSGRTAKKSITKLRAANEKSASKFYGPSDHNRKRGKLTETIVQTEKNGKKEKPEKRKTQKQGKKALVFASMDDRPETGLLAENRMGEKEESSETTPLAAAGETEDLLSEKGDAGATMELENTEKTPRKSTSRSGGLKLTVLDEVILVNTDEVIP